MYIYRDLVDVITYVKLHVLPVIKLFICIYFSSEDGAGDCSSNSKWSSGEERSGLHSESVFRHYDTDALPHPRSHFCHVQQGSEHVFSASISHTLVFLNVFLRLLFSSERFWKGGHDLVLILLRLILIIPTLGFWFITALICFIQPWNWYSVRILAVGRLVGAVEDLPYMLKPKKLMSANS